jgi:hypothetical protein
LPLFDPRHTESSHPHLAPTPCLCGSSGFKFPTMLQPEHMLCDTGNATSTIETPLLVPPPCETSLSARGSHEISEDEIDDMSTACCHICLKLNVSLVSPHPHLTLLLALPPCSTFCRGRGLGKRWAREGDCWRGHASIFRDEEETHTRRRRGGISGKGETP